MGISSSNNRRRNNNNYYNQNQPSQLISSSSSYPATDQSYSSPPYIYSPAPPPPPPPGPVYHHPYSDNSNNTQLIVRPNFGGFINQQQPQVNYNYGWGPPMRPPHMMPVAAPMPPPPTYVDHQQAKKVKNHVNLHKDTLKIEVDEMNADCYLVSFVFDALFDGRLVNYVYLFV